MSDSIFIDVNTSYSVPLKSFKSMVDDSSVSILILPALGVAAKFYVPLAREFSAKGVNAIIFEQRGYGDSALRPSRGVDYGFREWLVEDIPAAVDWIKKQFGPDLSILGHSLGGHLASCYVGMNPKEVDKLILPATGSPWIGAYSGKMKTQLRVLSFLIPMMTAVLGYYNGRRLGFGGMEAKRLILDWRSLVPNNKYTAKGIELDFEGLIGDYKGRVLSMRFDQDFLAPERAVEAVNKKFKSADIQRQVITKEKMGIRADHFNWVKQPEVCVNSIVDWLGN